MKDQLLFILVLEGTVSVVSSDLPCKDDNAQFSTVPLKACFDQVLIRSACFSLFKLFIFICGFSTKGTFAFVYNKKIWSQKIWGYLPHFWSDSGFKGTVNFKESRAIFKPWRVT